MKKLLRKLFPHKHKWEASAHNKWLTPIEEHCKCGVYRHHYLIDVNGAHIDWREGPMPAVRTAPTLASILNFP